MSSPTSTDDLLARLGPDLDARLAAWDAELERAYPGERPGRQPVHTVYLRADRYEAGAMAAHGADALALLDDMEEVLRDLTSEPGTLDRVRAKLGHEPVEDLRIDFEDGYGPHTDDAEDADAVRAATLLAQAQREGSAAPHNGIRIRCFERPTRARSVRTLTLFVSTLLAEGGHLRDWVATLPKVTSTDQVEAMVHVCAELERELGLEPGTLRFELQIETPQSILGADGAVPVARMVHAAGSRVTGLHYGTYDYSAFCGIAAAHQSLEHPVADHAKLTMQAAVAGTGVRLSDGSTNVLPLGDAEQRVAACANHYRLVRRSLERGYYQGWDLHPTQLPTRYAATYDFFRSGMAGALDRLAAYLPQVDGAAALGAVSDEPATARALAAYLLRGIDCGAVGEDEVRAALGTGSDRLRELSRTRTTNP